MVNRPSNIFQFVGKQQIAEEDTVRIHKMMQDLAINGDLVGSILIPFYRHGQEKKFSLAVTGWPAENDVLAAGALGICWQIVANSVAHELHGTLNVPIASNCAFIPNQNT